MNFGLRQLWRLIVWGEHASAVLRVKMLDIKEYNSQYVENGKSVAVCLLEREVAISGKIACDIPLKATYHIRLYNACTNYLDREIKTDRKIRTIGYLGGSNWRHVVSALVVIVIASILLLQMQGFLDINQAFGMSG